MLIGAAVWQDYILASSVPSFAGSVTVGPITGYDGEWWRMVERRNKAAGGRIVNYIPRNPVNSIAVVPELSRSVLCNLIKFDEELQSGAVAVIDKIAVIPARSWWLAGFGSRPQRGDTLETPQETFFVEHAEVVEREAPDGVVRDLKYRLHLAGASHRRP